LRARHRLSKFLLRAGQRPAGVKAWTLAYMARQYRGKEWRSDLPISSACTARAS